tara:strand:- start:114563 stop:115162 length:600 start_codon:yes stop_codon:yes gene_type:complete
LLLSLGCAAAGPPKGPKHVPSNTEEARTACPKERKAAQAARELLLGSDDPAAPAKASERVLAHGHCEAKAALAMPRPVGTQEQVLDMVRAIRVAVRDASSLFSEVRRYDDETNSQESFLADAKLTIGFADMVASVGQPTDLEPMAAGQFQAELRDASKTLRGQAEMLIQQALASAPNPAHQSALCELLRSLDGSSAACP